MQLNKRQSGLTLLEIIISVAMIGLLTLGFMTFFSKGFFGVVNAGQSSQALFESQRSLEAVIGAGSGTSTVTYDFAFDFGNIEFIVPGKIESFAGNSGSQEVNLKAFIPVLNSGGIPPAATDDEIIQAALDSMTSLTVTDADNNNSDIPKPTVQKPAEINAVVFTFDSCDISGSPGVDIGTGVVIRHTTNELTARLVVKGTLNASALTKTFLITIPKNKPNPSDVTAIQE